MSVGQRFIQKLESAGKQGQIKVEIFIEKKRTTFHMSYLSLSLRVESGECRSESYRDTECTTGQYSHCFLSTYLQLFSGLSEDMHIVHRILHKRLCFQTCKKRAPTTLTAARLRVPDSSLPLDRTGPPEHKPYILPRFLTTGNTFNSNKIERFFDVKGLKPM